MRTLFSSLAVMFCLVSGACNNGAIDKIENRFHCQKICDKFGECFGGDHYDTDQCNKECRDKSSEDSFDQKATACKDCLDGISSCTSATVHCTDECADVVIQSNLP